MSGAPRPGALPPEIQRAIAREDVIALPIRRWEGETRVIASPEDVEAAMADIRAESVVGFDTETRPAFRKGEHHLPSLAQVATARAVYIFQLRRTDCSAALAELLGAAGIVKAGVALAHDLRELKQLFAFEERAVFDAGLVARRHGLKQSGVRNLAAIFLGLRIPKGAKTTNWAAPRLSPVQIAYAATDAWACRELYLRFEALGLR
ncbi:MAG: 3'-5' exonuclease domain-containing protein 2 [Betaproteobacteria bacterium]|nr:3'-5' exonuclease domain-containing protein 2 [Betaproteobacteria bacterium]